MSARSRTTALGVAVLSLLAAASVAGAPAQAATGCEVSYTVSGQWQGGFQGAITIRNTGDAVTSWSLAFSFPDGQTVTQGWGGRFGTGSSAVTVTNESWNGALPTGAGVEAGFIGSWNGTANRPPASFSLNGVSCGGQGSVTTTTRTATSTSSTSATRTTTTSATTRTTTSATTRTTTTTAGTGAKPFKGVGNAACSDLGRLGMSWWYNWYITPGSCGTGEFVPMVSGKDKHGAGDIAWSRDQAINGGYKTILGFNEPNKAEQANMTVATAVSLWPTLTSNPSIRIGSPATSADGQAWFTDFMNQVQQKNLRVDFIALHWYGWNAGSCDANASQFENYLKWAESFPGNRPIWITEFGCMNASNPNMATVTAFYRGVLAVLARHPRVERYAWYPWNTNNELVSSSGALTTLGTAVANAAASR